MRRFTRHIPFIRAVAYTVAAFTVLYTTYLYIGALGAVVSTPIRAVGEWYAHSAAALPTYLRGVDALREENATLREENARLQESDAYRAYLALLHDATTATLPEMIQVGVFMAPPATPYDVLVVQGGTEAGLKEGALVYAGARVVGSVARVYTDHAFVVLFSSPRARTSVYLPAQHMWSVAEGMGGGVVRVTVPQDVPLAIGDIVLAPGLGQGYVGTLASLDGDPTQPEKYGYITAAPLHAYRTLGVAREPAPMLEYAAAQHALSGVLERYAFDSATSSTSTATSTR